MAQGSLEPVPPGYDGGAALALDGAYLYEPDSERSPEFVALAPPTSEDVARVLAGTARRLRRLLEAIESPAVARAILACTGLPARAPPEPMPPAELDVQLDVHPEPARAFEFDQSSPYED